MQYDQGHDDPLFYPDTPFKLVPVDTRSVRGKVVSTTTKRPVIRDPLSYLQLRAAGYHLDECDMAPGKEGLRRILRAYYKIS